VSFQRPAVAHSVDELSVLLQDRRPGTYVLVDGLPLAGKTSTGRELSASLRLPFYDLDSFLLQKTGRYVSALDLPRIAEALRQGPCVAAGVCMRAIHEAVGSPPAVHVYVKRMAAAGWGWADEDEAEGDSDLDALCPPSDLRLELRSYHATANPAATADVIFERMEQWAP
jgi:hypothetical protein